MKKLIITLIVLAVLITGGYFGIKAYRSHKQNSDPVKVYSLAGYYGNGWYDDYSNSMSGSVSSAGDQRIYVDSEKTVGDVFAIEGSKVNSGDVLMTYDTTQESLKLDTLYSELSVYKTELTLAYNELTKLNNTTPSEDMTTETTTEAEDASDTDAPEDDDDDDDNNEQVYTRYELNLAIQKKKDEIATIQNNIDNQDLAIRKQERVISQNTVVAEVSGIVMTVDMTDERTSSGEPNIVISTTGTYTATVSVGEYNLSKMHKGTEVSVYCYDTGNRYTGSVVDIGVSPNGENTYPVIQSQYPVKVAIDDADGIQEGSYVEVTLTDDGSDDEEQTQSDELIIPMYFVKQENSKYYVMKEVDGRLKKQYLNTGKIYYGTEIVVKGGVTMNDFVAFPYEKDAVEGKVCVESEDDALY